MKNKKLLTLVWLLFLASCSSSNTDVQSDVSTTTTTDNVADLTSSTSSDSWTSESLNTNIKKTEVAKWNSAWKKQYRWWDTNTKAS